jgi:hypothetical protein
VRLISAAGIGPRPSGIGILRVPATTPIGYYEVACYYTPEIKSTIVSPISFGSLLKSRYAGWTLQTFPTGSWTFHAHSSLRSSDDIIVHGVLSGGLCYTQPLLFPGHPNFHLDQSSSTPSVSELVISQIIADDLLHPDTHNYLVHHLNARATKILWHERLGHCHDDALYNAHKHIDGVPQFKKSTPVLDQCPICLAAKLKARSVDPSSTTRKASLPYQGLSIDFGFVGQKSKNKSRAADFTGLNGETCYLLLADHATRELDGVSRVSKATPLDWLRSWLSKHNVIDIPDKYVMVDQGGELFHNPKFRKLFKEFGYHVQPTGAGSSHQNGPVERPHQTLGNALRAMLSGANLTAGFWPYAFQMLLRIKNSLPSSTQAQTPHELRYHTKAKLSDLRTFGCRVWVKPPGKRKGRLLRHARKGTFLGYMPHTTKNILYFDLESKRVKIAYHARFDEGMNDLPVDSVPPNVLYLQRAQDGLPIPSETTELTCPLFDFSSDRFHDIAHDEIAKIICVDPTFGFDLGTDVTSNRVYISAIRDRTSASTLCSSPRAARRKYIGAFVTAINDEPVFTSTDIRRAFQQLRAISPTPSSFTITLAPKPLPTRCDRIKALRELDLYDHFYPDPLGFYDDDTAPTLSFDELLAIHALRTDTPLSDLILPTIEDMDFAIQAISSHELTAAEQALGSFTRRKLQTLDTWPLWQAGEHKQIDQFWTLGMYGAPCRPPPGAIVLRPHWNYKVKSNGSRRSRKCCDGSPRAVPDLHAILDTYSSCIEMPIFRLQCALAAAQNQLMFAGDAQDAYAHSPGPSTPCYLRIDDAFADWWSSKFGSPVDRSMVIPIQRALQGHPEAGRLWEDHITGILKNRSDFGFQNTIHEKNIYHALINGSKTLLCRQVDDFNLAVDNAEVAHQIYDVIGRRLQLPNETKVPFEELGLTTDFNGVNVLQTRHYNKIHATSYIKRLLESHKWSTQSSWETKPGSKPFEPLSPSSVSSLYYTVGPAEHTPEHAALESELGFSYRTLLGEILYAYVVCRPDIGYAITTLSKFSKAPSRIHFSALKRLALYLRATMDWGIHYWRPSPRHELPEVPFSAPVPDVDTVVPQATSFLELVGYVDSAHANDLRQRRSTTGYGFMLAGGVVAWRTKTQSITATSSTEAEFLAAVSAAKVAKYLRMVLKQLGFEQTQPTILYEDNVSAIRMINAMKPTERSRHIDIQFFAIQDWRQQGHLRLLHVPGIVNPADDLTKALGWVLHSRHARRFMGHFGPPVML